VVIVTPIWQKLSSVERNVMLIITHYWQLLSEIIGETLLLVKNIWRNPLLDLFVKNGMKGL
jgi:hypothetical protein